MLFRSVEACAAGIVRVANAEMVRALRVMTVERGVDPRRFALLAFGGAGPLHAAVIADELGIRRILVPHAGGVLSALGLAAAERRAYAQRTVLLRGDELDDAALERAREALRVEALATLSATAEVTTRVVAEVRYAGQSHELSVPADANIIALRQAFADAHEGRYGYRDPDGQVELVDRKSTRLNSSHIQKSRMPSSA